MAICSLVEWVNLIIVVKFYWCLKISDDDLRYSHVSSLSEFE
jgi:hypothetical protein